MAVLCGGAWLDAAGLASYPWVGGLCLLGLALATFWLPRPAAAWVSTPSAHDSIKQVLSQRPVQWFFVSAFLMIFAHAVLYAYYSLYLDSLGYSPTMIGFLWALGVMAEIVFFFFQARFLNRLSRDTWLCISFVMCALRFFLMGSLAHMWAWLVVAQLLHAFTFALHHSVSVALVQHYFSPKLTMRGQALYVVVSYGLGGSLGGLAATYWWASVSPAAAFIAAGVVALVGLGACWKMRQALRHVALLSNGVIK